MVGGWGARVARVLVHCGLVVVTTHENKRYRDRRCGQQKTKQPEKAMYSTNYVRPNGRVSTNKCIGATFKLLCVIVDMYQCLIL